MPLNKVISYVPDQCMGLSLGLTQDVFRYASLVQQKVTGQTMDVQLVSIDGAAIESFSGLRVEVDLALHDVEDPDLVIIHPWWGELEPQLKKQEPLLKALKEWHEAGVLISAPTTASYFLAEAGLLENKLCTTHWHKHEDFMQRYPNTLCQKDRFITAANDVFCSAGLNAGLEIMVYLLKRYSHEEVGQQVEHTFLADFRRSYQHDFIHLADQSRHTDEAILACQQWIELHYRLPITVQELADQTNMSLRTFKRRFTEATGEAPLHYLQKIRVEQGREYLKHSNKTVSEIAWEVGYEDPGHFNRLFKRAYGETPAKWRKALE